jgi:iron-sulfur cluster repair protein YtfE (RIC family)
MNLIKTIKEKFAAHHEGGCGCGGHRESNANASPTKITKDMIVREVADRWPQTVAVFGNHKVDFCCGGAHSIEQTARARGCQDIDALLADLNHAVETN